MTEKTRSKDPRPNDEKGPDARKLHRQKVLVLDVDGVIYRRFFLLAASWRVGFLAWIRAWILCAAFEQNRIEIGELLERTFARFKGFTERDFIEIWRRMKMTPGTRELITRAKALGCHVVLLSSGFPHFLLQQLANDLGVHTFQGMDMEFRNGRFTGRIAGEITVAQAKTAILEKILQGLNADWEDVAVIADDRNNADLMKRSGCSIGFHADRVVRRIAKCVCEGSDLSAAVPILEAFAQNREFAEGDRSPIYREWVRKLVHCGGAAVPIAYKFVPHLTIAGLASVVLLYTIAEQFRLTGTTFPLFGHVTNLSARRNEIRRFAYAPVLLAVGSIAALLLLPWPAATVGIWTAALGDTAASIIGRRFGHHRIPWSRDKSFEGTAAGFIISALTAMAIAPAPAALIGAAAGMLAETIPLSDLDNLVTPLAAGFAAGLLVGA